MVRRACAGTTVSIYASRAVASSWTAKRTFSSARQSARRRAVGLALFAVVFPTSALATSGLLCTPIGGAGPKLSLVIGEGLAGVNLIERGRILSTFDKKRAFKIAQSWIDERDVRLDLVNRIANRHEVRLRASFDKRQTRGPTSASGTLQRLGRTYRVRCIED